jgi:uncharacterized protein YbjQ (UPF0145 family)
MAIFNRPTGPAAVWEPPEASARLAATAGANPNGVFTSDLSVAEYALLCEAGYEPLGFVVGSTIYHVGIQQAIWNQNTELEVLTQAMYNARELAMSRMRNEAQQLGADGVVGVELLIQDYSWTEDELEFMAAGTAVRSQANPGSLRAPDGGPFTSNLSAQDFYRLLAAGATPVAFVLGTCVYHIAHQSLRQSYKQMRQAGQSPYQNAEIPMFTQGVYEARELALTRMQDEAAQAGANGIVGVQWKVHNYGWGGDGTEFFATGTAIRKQPGGQKAPTPTFTLGLDA